MTRLALSIILLWLMLHIELYNALNSGAVLVIGDYCIGLEVTPEIAPFAGLCD